MKTISIETRKKDEIIDITEEVQKLVQEEGVDEGAALVFVAHTSCGITTADMDPGTDLDFTDFLRNMTPKVNFRHPHDPEHTPDHILASIIGPTAVIPIDNGTLKLGTWQKIVLVELNGPKIRTVNLTLLEEE